MQQKNTLPEEETLLVISDDINMSSDDEDDDLLRPLVASKQTEDTTPGQMAAANPPQIQCPVCKVGYAVEVLEQHAHACLQEHLSHILPQQAKKEETQEDVSDQAASKPIPAAQNPQQQTTSTWSRWGASLSRMAESVARDIEHGIDKLSTAIGDEIANYNSKGEAAFQQEFGFPPQEELHGVYWCRILNGDMGISGTSYVSKNFFSFSARDCNLAVRIPWIVVSKIGLATGIKRQNSSAGVAPAFYPTASLTTANAIQLFTNDRKVHTFYGDILVLGPLHNHIASFSKWHELVASTWSAAKQQQQLKQGAAPLSPAAESHPLPQQQNDDATVQHHKQEEQQEEERKERQLEHETAASAAAEEEEQQTEQRFTIE